VGDLLHVGDFVFESVLRPVALDIDRLADAGAGKVRQKFVDQIVAPDGLVWTKDAWLHWSVKPRQIAAAPDVVVRVDHVAHAVCQLARPRTWAQMRSTEARSASRSR